MQKYDAFISYSSEDKHLVEPIAGLVGAGRRVFLDRTNIPPGTKWKEYLVEALQNSKMVVLLWCCHSAESEWVSKEIEIADKAGIPIVPFLLCSTPRTETVARYQWIDGRDVIKHACATPSHEDHVNLFASEHKLAKEVAVEFELKGSAYVDIDNVFKTQHWRGPLWKRKKGLIGGMLGFYLLVLALYKPFPSIFEPSINNLINGGVGLVGIVLVIVSLMKAVVSIFGQPEIADYPHASKELAITLETIFRLNERGRLPEVLEHASRSGGETNG